MVRLGRFERPTSGSGDQRSIQLSYRRADERPYSTARDTRRRKGLLETANHSPHALHGNGL